MAARFASALLLVCSLTDSASAVWVDGFSNSDPNTNSTLVGWTASFIRPALGTFPNLPSGDVDPSDDLSYLTEPGRIDGSVTLRAAHDGTNPGTLTLTTLAPLP
jgi:hypothetical protein